jgi:hypothetical protein
VNQDGAAIFLNQLLAHPQPKTRSYGAPRRKEGIKDLLHRICSDPSSIIGHRHSDAMAASRGGPYDRATEFDYPLLLNRIQAVCEQVCQQLPQLSGNPITCSCSSHYCSTVAPLVLILACNRSTTEAIKAETELLVAAENSR